MYLKPLEYFSGNTDIAKKDPNSFMIELKKHFKKFCQSGFCKNTTLHGYNYLCFADSTIYRCIWFILILVMNCVAIYFLVKNTEAYINGGLQYEIETSTASLKVSFPSLLDIPDFQTFWHPCIIVNCFETGTRPTSIPVPRPMLRPALRPMFIPALN